MKQDTIISLRREFFTDREQAFVREGELAASLFRYTTGVEGVRLTNARGEIAVLPFQGQQIWNACFDGRTLTMKSMFAEPNPTREYLRTYGAFLIHCGATAMGNPSPQDTHPLHGELPNAAYQEAFLAIGSDDKGPYIGIGGEYRHTVAFFCDYLARPLIVMRPGEAVVSVTMEIKNLRTTSMDYMYLAHINFRPLDNGRLAYSAPCTPKSVRVRTVIPSNIFPPEGYRDFLEQLSRDPSKHNILAPGLAFDPEVVFYLSYLADGEGWARTMMVHPDGYASYVGHKPGQLDHGVRWINRIADQDAIGLVLPATAEPDGFLAEKAKGNVRSMKAGESVRFDLEAGLLVPAQAADMEKRIGKILSGR